MEYQSYFGFQLPSVRLSERSKRFHVKYAASKISLIYWRTYRPNSHTCLLRSHCFLYQLSFTLLLYIALLLLLLFFFAANTGIIM